MLRNIPKNKNMKVLDYGCGAGPIFDELKRYFSFIYAIDIDKSLIFSLQKLYKNNISGIFLCDGKNSAFKDKTFDLVICRGVLHHIDDMRRAILEIKRVLKDGGYLALSEPCRDNRLWKRIGETFSKATKKFPPFHHIFTTQELERLLKKEGFSIICQEKFGYVGLPIAVFGCRFPVIKHIPISGVLARIIITWDIFFSKKSYLRNTLNWHTIITAEK